MMAVAPYGACRMILKGGGVKVFLLLECGENGDAMVLAWRVDKLMMV